MKVALALALALAAIRVLAACGAVASPPLAPPSAYSPPANADKGIANRHNYGPASPTP